MFILFWVETFALAGKSDLNEEVKQVCFEGKKSNMEKAKRCLTPQKKRVRETLDKEQTWNLSDFNDQQNTEDQMAVIETMLWENQKECQKF